MRAFEVSTQGREPCLVKQSILPTARLCIGFSVGWFRLAQLARLNILQWHDIGMKQNVTSVSEGSSRAPLRIKYKRN